MAPRKTHLFATAAIAIAFATAALGKDVSLTIYSSADPAGFDPLRYIEQQRGGFNFNSAWGVPGFGVVKQVRTVKLKKGQNQVPLCRCCAIPRSHHRQLP